MYRLILIFLTLFFILEEANAQKNYDYTYTNRLTKELYLKENWDNLMSESNRALKEGTDFYDMRIRRGIALMVQKKYRAAIPEFIKARKFFPGDTTSIYYLHNAYAMLGRNMEVQQIGRLLPKSTQQLVGFKKTPFLEMGVFGSTSSFTAESQLSKTITTNETAEWGSYNSLYGYGAYISHLVGSKISFTHSYSNFSFGNFYKINYPAQKNTFYHTGYQFNGSTEMKIQMTKSSKLGILAQYTYINVPYHSFNTKANAFTESVFAQGGTLLGLNFIKYTKALDLIGAVFYNNLSDYHTLQGTAGINIFPMGNESFSIKTNFTYLANLSETNSNDLYQLVFQTKLVKQLGNKIWIEGGYLNGNMQNFTDRETNTIFYIADRTKEQYQANLFVLLGKHLKLYLKYTLLNRENDKITVTPLNTTIYKTISYSSNQFSSTLIWKF